MSYSDNTHEDAIIAFAYFSRGPEQLLVLPVVMVHPFEFMSLLQGFTSKKLFIFIKFSINNAHSFIDKAESCIVLKLQLQQYQISAHILHIHITNELTWTLNSTS